MPGGGGPQPRPLGWSLPGGGAGARAAGQHKSMMLVQDWLALKEEQRLSRFQAIHAAVLARGVATGHYLAMAITEPSPPLSYTQALAWAIRAEHGHAPTSALLHHLCRRRQWTKNEAATSMGTHLHGWAVSPLQLAQRRLAFACACSLPTPLCSVLPVGRLLPTGRHAPGASSLEVVVGERNCRPDILDAIGAAMAYPRPWLRFTRDSVDAAFAIDEESDPGGVRLTAARDPAGALAMCAERISRGRSSAAFTIVRPGGEVQQDNFVCTAGLTLFGVARAGLNPHRGGFANSMAKSFEIGYRSADVFLLGSASGDLFNACGRFGWPGQRGFGAGDTLELLLDCDAGWLAVKLNGRL